MHVEDLDQVAQEKALVAIYTCRSRSSDTLYLAQGLIQGGGYTYYSDGYFIGYTGVMDSAVTIIQAEKPLAHYRNGKSVGLTMTSDIPELINALNDQKDTLITFELYRTSPSNISSGGRRSIIKAWREILR